MVLTVVTREQWGARHEDGAGDVPEPAAEAWLHHTVAMSPDLAFDDLDGDGLDDDNVAAMRQIETIGEQRFGRGASYNRVPMPNGRIFVGVSWHRRGAHLAKRNTIARSYALPGNYDRRRPTAAQVEGIARDLVRAKRRGHLRRARLDGGHGDAPGAATACPGRHGRAAIPAINARAAEIERLRLDPDDLDQEDLMASLDDLRAVVRDVVRKELRDQLRTAPVHWLGGPDDRQPLGPVLRDIGHHARLAAARTPLDAETFAVIVLEVLTDLGVRDVDERAIAEHLLARILTPEPVAPLELPAAPLELPAAGGA